MDPEEYRAESRERWTSVAAGWNAQRERMSNATKPVTQWLVDALELAPGKTILELACGPGEVGLAAVERVRPGGKLIATDTSDAMVETVRDRAAELGLDDVDPRVMDAEWIDMPTASVDAIVCRWGFMLFADPGASLIECRRVLRPGGRLSLAAWAGAERNPWASAVGIELVSRGRGGGAAPGGPGEVAWGGTPGIAHPPEGGRFVAARGGAGRGAF